MSVTYCYVALLDVLSYRVRLQNDVEQGTYVFKDDLEDALSVFSNVNAATFSVQAISDTIIITCKHHSDFPELLSLLQSVFFPFYNAASSLEAESHTPNIFKAAE